MNEFNAQLEVVDGITVLTAEGLLTVQGLVDMSVSGFYGLTRQAIWDLRMSYLSGMNRDEYVALSRGMAANEHKRHTVSAAIVLGNREDLVSFRYYTLVGAHETGQRVQMFLTCDMNEARDWLKSVEHMESWDADEQGMQVSIQR